MFDRSASVRLQLRDKKGKWIKMGMHVKWHSLEEDADVTGIARGESGNNIIVEFSHGGQTYHINVPHNKVEGINEKAHLDPAYVEHMGGHINSPNIADHGVTTYHTVTHYGVESKNPNAPLTTKISDLKPGDVVYPIKNHSETTPSSIQKSPYNVKEPTTKAQMQKFATSGHGVVKKIAYDKETGNAKYAVITDSKGKDHFPSAQHYAVKQHDTLDKAILDAHANESQAMGHTTKSGLVDDVKGVHTTQDKFDASKAPVGTKVQIPATSTTTATVTKTAEGKWKEEGKAHTLSDTQVSTFIDHANGHFTPYLDTSTSTPVASTPQLPDVTGYNASTKISGDSSLIKNAPEGTVVAPLNKYSQMSQYRLVKNADGTWGVFKGDQYIKKTTTAANPKTFSGKLNVWTKPTSAPVEPVKVPEAKPEKIIKTDESANVFGDHFSPMDFNANGNAEEFKVGDKVTFGADNFKATVTEVVPADGASKGYLKVSRDNPSIGGYKKSGHTNSAIYASQVKTAFTRNGKPEPEPKPSYDASKFSAPHFVEAGKLKVGDVVQANNALRLRVDAITTHPIDDKGNDTAIKYSIAEGTTAHKAKIGSSWGTEPHNAKDQLTTFVAKDPAQEVPQGPQTSEPAKETPLDISGWTKKPGTQMGSNAGGIYTDQHGNDWYVKLSQSDDHARSEVLADDLYKAAGVQTSNLKLANVGGGKLGTASQMMPNTKQDLSSHLNDPAYMAKIQDGFAMDALLANWDVAGLGYDNIITDQHGNPVRVDPGGALLFRAQGQPKGDQFGNKVGEWESLRGQGSHSNAQATALFGKMTDQQLADSAKHVEALTPEKINSIVDSIGFDYKTATELKDKLAARREDILAHAAKLSPAPVEAPSEAPAENAAPKEYSFADLTALPNGAMFSGPSGSLYKYGNKWFMTFTPNSNKDGMSITTTMVQSTLKNKPDFKPVGDTHTVKPMPDAPDTNFYDQLPAHDKALLAEPVTHVDGYASYAYSSANDPHHLFPGYNKAEKEQAADFISSSLDVNNALRNDATSDYTFEIATLDQILNKSPLASDTTVYRGLNARDEIVNNLVNGGIYSDKGYTSTSTTDKIGHEWVAYTDENRTPVLMEIQLPAGFKAHKLDYNALGSHSFSNESEVVLPHGTKFKVTAKEAYTNTSGQSGWKVTMTPYLTEHNFDTGGQNDHTEGSPEGHGAGADSEQVHGNGGSDSAGHTGGDSVSGPADTSAPSAPQEEPTAQGQVAPQEPASHPDFNATYPDKGKDQIDSKGNTIKVNDLIHHPKKGVGKVFIGLPSTNSVKVVYPDGSKATHLSKAVTKVEGDAPKVEALPSDLKIGDHGIDPATHTAYIVGTNNSLIHIGDTVTHSSGDTGTVKSIYKGEKTVSVKWDNGTTSTKKASTLESGTKHAPETPTTPQVTPAPVQEPVHAPVHEPQAPEPAHVEPSPVTPEPVSEPNGAPSLVGKSLGDAGVPTTKDLPEGTVLHNDAVGLSLTKVPGGMWKSQYGDDYHGGTIQATQGLHDNDWKVVSTPSEDGHTATPQASAPSEDLSTKDPSHLTPEDLAALPIGTTIHKGPDSSFYKKKIGENQWQMTKSSNGQPAFGFSDSDQATHEALQNNPGAYKTINLPENSPEPTAPSVSEAAPEDHGTAAPVSVPSMLKDPSVDDLAKLPEGTVLTDPKLEGFTYTKQGDTWLGVGPNSNGYANPLPPSSIADGSDYHVQPPEGVSVDHTSTPSPTETPSMIHSPSTSDLAAYPDGTVLTDPTLEGFTFTKNGDVWDQVGPSGQTQGLSPHSLADGSSYHVQVPSTLHDPSAEDLAKLPDGTVITDASGSYTKSGDHWTEKSYGLSNTISSSDMADGSTYQVQLPADHVAEPSAPLPAPSATTPAHETGVASVTGVSTGQPLSKELLDAQPVGATMKKESSYGSSAFYYIKQSDGTWKLFKNGQETTAAPYISDSIKSGNTTATFGVPTPGTKFFYSKTGEITYEGDKVSYKGESGTISSITNTGLVSVKLDGEHKAKYKAASTLIKTPTYGKKDVPAFEPAPTPNMATTPSSESHTGGTDTLNFAGASAATYDHQGLTMPSAKNDSHLTNGLTLSPTHEPDLSNPLYNTPAPEAPTAPAAYPAFQAPSLDLPKWDSAKWLDDVKARYAANPHKAKPTLEESANWGKIQSILNGDEIHLDSLVNSKYLDENLKKQAIDGIVKQESLNKPMIKEHDAKVADAKKEYDASKAKYLNEYATKKAEFTQKMSAWVAANPNKDALKPIQLPETSKENFVGGTADWSKAHAGTFTAQSVFDSIKKDSVLGTKGLSIATDSDQVEALDANVMKILDTNGKPVLRVKMKLTGPYGDSFEKHLKTQAGVTTEQGIYSNYLVKDHTTGLLRDKGIPPAPPVNEGKWVHDGTRYTWTDPSTGAMVRFQRSANQGMNVSGDNNSVTIHLPENAGPEEYQKVLENMGINAKPSTEGDIRVLAENQLLSMFGKSTITTKIYDGTKNLNGVERAKQLKEIEDKHGVTPNDLTFASEANGRVRFFLNDEKAQKMVDDSGIKGFVHSVSDSYGADTWVNMLTGPNNGLLSTYHRWNEGIGGKGLSSVKDHMKGSSDYVYTTPQASLPTYGYSVVINPKSIFRRTDWWANTGDDYGKKGLGTSTSPHHTLENVMGGSKYNYGIHEALPKDSVPVSDWMYVTMGSSTRDSVIKALKDKGVLQINGIPVEDFILPEYGTPPQHANTPTI